MDDKRPPSVPSAEAATVLVAEEPQPAPLVVHADGRLEHPGVGFENSDVHFLPIAITALLLGATLGIAAGAVRWLEPRAEAPPRKRAAIPLPKSPRLEPLAPSSGPQSFTAAERAAGEKLHSYGPADEPGYMYVPIEHAIQAVAKGLRSASTPPPTATRDPAASGDANSGRWLGEARR